MTGEDAISFIEKLNKKPLDEHQRYLIRELWKDQTQKLEDLASYEHSITSLRKSNSNLLRTLEIIFGYTKNYFHKSRFPQCQEILEREYERYLLNQDEYLGNISKDNNSSNRNYFDAKKNAHNFTSFIQQTEYVESIETTNPSQSTLDKNAGCISNEDIGLPECVNNSKFRSLIADKTQDFVGREYIFKAINNFIADNKNGYFAITGDPGQGKSAILAKYVQDTNCITHFNSSLEGPNRTDQFLESICEQIIKRYQLPHNSLPPNATRDGVFLKQLLEESAKKRNGQPIIIAVDALDEVDRGSNKDSLANILFLPPNLPDDVYFILTRRRGVDVPFTVYTPFKSLSLLDYQSDSERDVISYIQKRIKNSEKLRLQIAERGETIEDFTNKISNKSENNFMYLRGILLDIEEGEYKDYTLEEFPKGLKSYYMFHWRQMGMIDYPLPIGKIRIVITLGVVKEPVSQRKICHYTREEPSIIEHILLKWRQFLHLLVKDDEKRYRIYHPSYREFLYDLTKEDYPVTFKEIYGRIARIELKLWGKIKGELKDHRYE
jgi:serine/threonine-protein kinase